MAIRELQGAAWDWQVVFGDDDSILLIRDGYTSEAAFNGDLVVFNDGNRFDIRQVENARLKSANLYIGAGPRPFVAPAAPTPSPSPPPTAPRRRPPMR